MLDLFKCKSAAAQKCIRGIEQSGHVEQVYAPQVSEASTSEPGKHVGVSRGVAGSREDHELCKAGSYETCSAESGVFESETGSLSMSLKSPEGVLGEQESGEALDEGRIQVGHGLTPELSWTTLVH